MVFFILLLMLPFRSFSGNTDTLFATFWCELEPFIKFEGDQVPLDEETAIRRLLEEARIVFSSMIYGYRFTYTPSDKKRKIDEVFRLEPVAQITWGDPHLEITASGIREKRLYADISFTCEEFQLSRISAWRSLSIPAASGRGSADLFKGYTEKMAAFSNAIREAIRDYMQKRTFNKPREIKGELVLLEMPDTVIHAGEYITRVKIKLNIKEVIPYKVF